MQYLQPQYLQPQYQEPQSSNTIYIILGIVVVLILLGLFMIWTSSSSSTSATDYSFYPYMDSKGNDIIWKKGLANKVAELKAKCDELSSCVGFNTNAWLKYKIRPQSQWVKWEDDPNKGLYIKSGVSY